MQRPDASPSRTSVTLAVVVAALGYFVDIFDLLLFALLRKKSLSDVLGAQLAKTPTEQHDALLKDWGIWLDNTLQMTGLMVGGILWGVLGDRLGRLTVLFGSILTYSISNLLNACVADVDAAGALGFLHAIGLGTAIRQYEVLRFLAGIGLAGELGAGITLVAELTSRERRGIATTIVASVGILGAVVAYFVTQLMSWRAAFAVGGGLGLALLALRVGVVESGLFMRAQSHGSGVSRGNPLQLLWPPRRFLRFAAVVLSAMPIWFVGGVMFVFGPEIGKAMGIAEPIMPAKVILWAYLGVVVGDVASGLISQFLRSRTRTIMGFQAFLAASIVLFFAIAPRGPEAFYGMMCLVGAATGYWAIFVTTASEQFGTNLRATAATSAPNFVRAMAVPITSIWLAMKPGMGAVQATLTLGVCCVAVGMVAALAMDETFHRDLDYLER